MLHSRSWMTPTRSVPTRPSPGPLCCRPRTYVRCQALGPCWADVGFGTNSPTSKPQAWCGRCPCLCDPEWPAAQVGICTQLLTLVSSECDVPKKPLVLSCQADMAACAQPGQQNCSCATLSEYSRRCSMAHRPVSNWRGPGLCCESRHDGVGLGGATGRPLCGGWAAWPGWGLSQPCASSAMGQCPANQEYQECGTACIRTCSNPQHRCSSPCTSGCFCPQGEAGAGSLSPAPGDEP